MSEILWHIPTILLVVAVLPPLVLLLAAGTVVVCSTWWSCCEVIWEAIVDVYKYMRGGGAQMKFNINNYASVTLTEYGAKVYNSRYDDLKAAYPNLVHTFQDTNVQAGHVVKAQLWSLFQTFGPFISLGSENPFENCIMTFDEKDFYV